MAIIRLDKLLADSGAGTRSEVKTAIKKGMVKVNGTTVTDNGKKINTEDEVMLNGKIIGYSKYTYLMLNKPAGVISATTDKNDKTVTDLLNVPYKNMSLFPVGRLDKDTVGLVLLTNDGDFAHNTLSPKKHVTKTYYVESEGDFSSITPDDIIPKFKDGIMIDGDYLCKSALLEVLEMDNSLIKANLTITEGKFHQVKRMFKAIGGKVTYLKRMTFGDIQLDHALTEGEYRTLNKDEMKYIDYINKA
jgi:16S rRNA pseudouridine516 synthase